MANSSKKQGKLVPFAIIGVASVVVVGGMIVVAGKQQQAGAPRPAAEQSSLPADNATFGDIDSFESFERLAEAEAESFQQESDRRLAALREQEAELDEIYLGTDSSVYQGDPDDPALLFGEGGQFSDFDSPSVPGDEALPSEPEPPLEPEIEPELFSEPVTTPDELLAQTMLDQQAAGWFDPELEERLDALEQRLEAIGRDLSALATTRQVDDIASESLVAPIKADVGSLQVQLASVNERLEAMGGNANGSSEHLDTLSENFEAFSSEVAQRLDGLETRLTEVSEETTSVAQAPAPAPQRAAPSRPAVNTLYQLLSIEGNVAVLRGQNTGRVYRIAEGGDLAYGGRLLDIRGDQAVLAWPHRTVELSIFGQ